MRQRGRVVRPGEGREARLSEPDRPPPPAPPPPPARPAPPGSSPRRAVCPAGKEKAVFLSDRLRLPPPAEPCHGHRIAASEDRECRAYTFRSQDVRSSRDS